MLLWGQGPGPGPSATGENDLNFVLQQPLTRRFDGPNPPSPSALVSYIAYRFDSMTPCAGIIALDH
jgi:hypothetical protein